MAEVQDKSLHQRSSEVRICHQIVLKKYVEAWNYLNLVVVFFYFGGNKGDHVPKQKKRKDKPY